MNFIVDNWYIMVAAAAVCIAIGYKINDFVKKPTDKQISKVKEWILIAVASAEKELGSGTGELKLRFVYDMFVTKFPYLVKVISFDQFSEYVDAALYKLEAILQSNDKVKGYIEQ